MKSSHMPPLGVNIQIRKNPATFIHNFSVSDTTGSGLHKVDSGSTGLTGKE